MNDLLDPMTLAALVIALGCAGAAVGFLAGLFGIGGGAISVPVFFEVFRILGHPPEIAMPLAVGTSLAVIVPTAIQSSRAHFRRGTVDMELLRLWALPVLAGVVLGAAIARFANPAVFQAAFVLVAAVNSTKLLTGGAGWHLRDTLPSRGALRACGAGVGFVSSLMGIGGGAVSNMILTLHGMPIHRAVSTSAGVGVLIAVPGTLGYILAGWGTPGLPPDALGFVSLATFVLTIPASLATTRFGVALAHRLSRRHLEVAFGVFLIVVSLRFVWAIISAAVA
jgi:uncharacterized membrane protein YfcA